MAPAQRAPGEEPGGPSRRGPGRRYGGGHPVSGGGLRRLLAVFAGLLGVLLVPLALSAPTAWLLLPAHLAFAVAAAGGALLEGLAGRPERARLWGLGYLVVSVGMVGTLEAAALLRGASTWYWAPPWLGALVWGWVPPVVSGLAGVIGELRQRRSTSRVVRVRRRELRERRARAEG